MKINRTAYVSRTAHDQTHGNKLVAPEYGVIELRLIKGAAKSKSYLPVTSSPRREPKSGGDDKFCFAPGTQWKEDTWTEDPAKTDTVKVWYDLYNPFSVITEAKLELFRRFDKKPYWERVLEKEELLEGEHELEFDPKGDGKKVKEWDGALGKKTDEFPDGFVTTEHSPYKLRLTVKGEGICQSPVVWTYFHILIEKIELEWGVPEAIPSKTGPKRQPFKDLIAKWTKPTDGTAGTPARIHLLSNLYKTSLAQMDNNTFFDSYKTMWEEGPEIPVFAKIWVRDSGGAKVVAPKALGNTKFLWDWESKLEAPANGFVKNAQDYYKATTKPKGQNCHKDRGGKRADDTKFVFPKQDGYAKPADTLTDGSFPFKVTPIPTAEPRKWASYSLAWRKGKLAGKTGVLFQPSRMAGDMYKITVHAAHEIVDAARKVRINVDTDAPIKIDDKLKAESGIWQVWRKTYLSRYIRKTSAMAKFFPSNLAGTAAHYAQAFVEMIDKIDAPNSYALADHKLSGGAAPNYNQICKDLLAASGTIFFTSHLATDSAADHKAESSMVKSRTYVEFAKKVHLHLHSGVAAAGGDLAAVAATFAMAVDALINALGSSASITTLTAVTAAVTRVAATQAWLIANGCATSNDYCGKVDDLCFNLGEPMANKLELVKGSKGGSKANPGVITMEFAYTHTYLRDQIAAGVGLGYWYGAAIDPTDADSERCVIMFWKAGVDEFSHEAGHHFFMPHAQSADGTRPGGTRDDRHDSADTACMMSYTPARPGFCGLCQLRMRGWTATALSKTSASNKKP
jgi:hypothetical protein